MNATIGGPHSSFTALANSAGGASSLMAHFLDGLKNVKKWGPPRVKSNPKSLQETDFAKAMNTFEDRSESEDLPKLENFDDYFEELMEAKEDKPDVSLVQQDLVQSKGPSSSTNLSDCEYRPLCDSLRFSSDLPANLVKRLMMFYQPLW